MSTRVTTPHGRRAAFRFGAGSTLLLFFLAPSRGAEDEPPPAKVYPDPPSSEESGIVFELAAATVSPGQQDVSLDLFVTSNFEYCGYEVSIAFPSRYLTIASVDEHVRPGSTAIDNQGGSLVLALENDSRRVAVEGERLRIATLHVDVSPAASEITEAPLRFATLGPEDGNSLAIQFLEDPSVSSPPATARVEPSRLHDAVLNVLPEILVFVRGDSNGDQRVDISDAMNTFNYLFIGMRSLRCFDAADANDDGKVNVSDPSAILNSIFLGTGPLPPPIGLPGEDPTPDALTCAGRVP